MYSVTLQYVLDSKLPILNKKEDTQFFKEDLFVSLSDVKLVGFVTMIGEQTNIYRPVYSPKDREEKI
ncbi:hypothetical protein CAX48_14105 [Listeria monocytogenes]|uniref:Uncharacterized protein n=1 Tax=Listeria monocytogenes TaxID=1639 RepID=A0A9P2FF29_LISMN|nr:MULTISPECIES: hypothetical protein [Listeria]EAC5235020.1 hypothetical protein [Listeria monocytogenes]EAC9891241.1 hypothetical protein [Listeria monocytogenes]EAD2540868.1 hypothetical protein [Listeria monocytogenes]EAD2655778.1 hypothetical protein [Listeria monocytogenes]EAD2804406.1 hypothetical protein [Listeria monocytogenes]